MHYCSECVGSTCCFVATSETTAICGFKQRLSCNENTNPHTHTHFKCSLSLDTQFALIRPIRAAFVGQQEENKTPTHPHTHKYTLTSVALLRAKLFKSKVTFLDFSCKHKLKSFTVEVSVSFSKCHVYALSPFF